MIHFSKVKQSQIDAIEDMLIFYPENRKLKCIRDKIKGKTNDRICSENEVSKSLLQKYVKEYIESGEMIESLINCNDYAKFIIKNYKSPMLLGLPYMNWSERILHHYLTECCEYYISLRSCTDILYHTAGIEYIKNDKKVLEEVYNFIDSSFDSIFFIDYLFLYEQNPHIAFVAPIGKWIILIYESKEDLYSLYEISAKKVNYRGKDEYYKSLYGGTNNPLFKEILNCLSSNIDDLMYKNKSVLLILNDNNINKDLQRSLQNEYNNVSVLLLQDIKLWCEVDEDYYHYIINYKNNVQSYIKENKGGKERITLKEIIKYLNDNEEEICNHDHK